MTVVILWIVVGVFVAFALPDLVKFGKAKMKKEDDDYNNNSNQNDEPKDEDNLSKIKKSLGYYISGVLIVIYGILSSSFISIEENHAGHVNKIFGASSLKNGDIIALNGEQGWQAKVLSPGFHIIFLVNVLNEVQSIPDIIIPKGQIGILKSQDGKPLQGDVVSPSWDTLGENISVNKMITNAKYFVENGGYKGTQNNVLLPGQYRINQKLFTVEIKDMTNVAKGHVGVVIAKTGKKYDLKNFDTNNTDYVLSVPIVPNGYKGIQKDYLLSGLYPVNPYAQSIVLVPVTAKVWKYSGGYTSRSITFDLNDKGSIVQKEATKIIEKPVDAADRAVNVKSKDGWAINYEVRAQVQIEPKNAPVVVAAVGGLSKLEDNIITPLITSTLATIGYSKNALVLKNQRKEIQKQIESEIKIKSKLYGATILGVKISYMDLDPALLLPIKRAQFAESMKKAFIAETQTNIARIETEKKKAEANQQADLIRAEINLQKAEKNKQATILVSEGQKQATINVSEGDRTALINIAKGQSAQANVLGKENVTRLKMFRIWTNLLEKNPDAVKVPKVYIDASGGKNGGGGDFKKALAMFAGSNFVKNLSIEDKTSKK